MSLDQNFQRLVFISFLYQAIRGAMEFVWFFETFLIVAILMEHHMDTCDFLLLE